MDGSWWVGRKKTEVLEESEVCQFGGFPPRKKTPGFFYLQIYVDFFDEYS
jgi:hypothetical protein